MFTLSFWGDDEMSAFPPKGEGKLVMTSDFVTIFGLLKYDSKTVLFYSKGLTSVDQNLPSQVGRGAVSACGGADVSRRQRESRGVA